MPAKNLQSQREASKRYYEKNKTYFIEKSARAKGKQRNFLRDIIRKEKDRPCADCGQMFPYYVMQFDHIGNDKSFNIANVVGTGISGKKLMDEIKKCEVVCSNCHAIRTYNRRIEGVEIEHDRKGINQLMFELFK